MMGYNIEYWSNRASDAHPTLLTVSLADPARLVVGSNADNPGPEPVGTFLAMPPAAEADALMQAARRLVHSPNPAIGPAIPGEEIRKLTIALDSGPQETRLATESSPPDQPFLAAETAAIAVAKALRLHPKAALSAQMTLRLDGAGHVEVALKVVNVGLDTVTIPHPDFWADGSVSIQVVTRRNDVALSELRNEHQQFVGLTKAQLVGTSPSLVPSPIIAIAPHRDLTFKFVAALVLPKGNYDVWLVLDTPLMDARGSQIMQAEIVSKKEQQHRIF